MEYHKNWIEVHEYGMDQMINLDISKAQCTHNPQEEIT